MPTRHLFCCLGVFVFLVSCSSALNAGDAADGCSESPSSRCYRQGSWWIAVSENFQVCSQRSLEEAKFAALRCEELRTAVNGAWKLSMNTASWRPRCQVLLYPNARSYVASVGPGSEATVGSSLVKPRTGPIFSRRIDLRADVSHYLEAALPHELCHLLVADRFRDRPAPLWYDEGLALLADQPEKLKLHQRDLREGVRQGIAFRVPELMSAKTYPASNRMGVFYGQCAALTQRLLELGAPAQLHEFVSIIPTVGVNGALRSTYGIGSLAELEQTWAKTDRLVSLQSVASLLPSRNSGEQFGFASVVK